MAAMTPGFAAVRRAAVEAGALGAGLSGSGPTTFAWVMLATFVVWIVAAIRAYKEYGAALVHARRSSMMNSRKAISGPRTGIRKFSSSSKGATSGAGIRQKRRKPPDAG